MTVVHHTPLSRGIALSLVIALFATLYLLLIVPLKSHYEDNRQELERLTRQLAGYERIANSRNEVELLLKSMRPQENALGYYLKGSTQALASAELQAYIRTIIEESSGNLVSTQPMVNGDRDPERLVRVNVRMRGSIDTLLQVLYRISNGVPILLTDELLIRPDKSALTRTQDAQADDTLDVQFTLTGFVKESVS